jgi:hypothetical protein
LFGWSHRWGRGSPFETFEFVDAGEYVSDGVAHTNMCGGLSVKAAHAAEVPARGVDPLCLSRVTRARWIMCLKWV